MAQVETLICEHADGGRSLYLTSVETHERDIQTACMRMQAEKDIKRVHLGSRRSQVETGIRYYDRQINKHLPFMTGNVVSNFQCSTFVRPPTQTECNGALFAPGYLTTADLAHFKTFRLPEISAWYKQFHENNPLQHTIAYVIRDSAASDRQVRVRGWLVTTTSHKLLVCTVVDRSPASAAIMEEAATWLTGGHVVSGELLLEAVDDSIVLKDAAFLSKLSDAETTLKLKLSD